MFGLHLFLLQMILTYLYITLNFYLYFYVSIKTSYIF